MQVLSVASEIYPLIKTGGLADVVGALPSALGRHNVEVRSLIPGYPAVIEQLDRSERVHETVLFGQPAALLRGRARGLDLFVIDAPHLYGRAGNPYTDGSGQDWPDNAERFAALGQAALMLSRGVAPGFAPEIVHAHDWQAGLAPAYLYYDGAPRPSTVITVHNLAFQGRFPAHLLGSLGLPPQAFTIDGVEFYGGIGFLKAGLRLADRITTVSPTYAAEIATPEGGMGLEGLLQARASDLSGILNGIDETVWNPQADPLLASPFGPDGLDAREANKRALQERFGLEPRGESLLFGVISRLSWQKGLDLLLAALPRLLANGGNLVLLGSGDVGLEAGFTAAAAAAPGRIGVQIGYDERLAHLIQGGSDAILVPSRFEPCGLTQLCALRYGALPIVSRVGGLSDTIIDANEMALAAGVATGFQFSPVTREALEGAITRAASLWHDRHAWRHMQESAMRADVGWSRPASRYAQLYRELIADRRTRTARRGLVGATGIEPVTPPV